jgi:hypothetical protein
MNADEIKIITDTNLTHGFVWYRNFSAAELKGISAGTKPALPDPVPGKASGFSFIAISF